MNLGLPFRILVSKFGLMVVMLSVISVYFWWEKCKTRVASHTLVVT